MGARKTDASKDFMAKKPKQTEKTTQQLHMTEEMVRKLFDMGYWMIDVGKTSPDFIKLSHKKGFNVSIPMSKFPIVLFEAEYAVKANMEIMGNYHGKQVFPYKFEIKLQTEPGGS